MGLQQSKDKLLYQQVNSGNVEGVKTLRGEGAGLEWTDSEGKTPLISACTRPRLYNVAETLIQLGANINAYRQGWQGGTPLHHAARNGLDQTVKLLLSHGANALIMNDDYQTPLDIARAEGYGNIVRTIEAHLCLFSGWLRELHGPGFLELLAPQLLSRKVWVVILPCGSGSPNKPLKLELVIYSSAQDAQPRTIIPLWKSNLDEPNFNQHDPAATISNISRLRRRWRRRRLIRSSQESRHKSIKFAPVQASERHELQRFCYACRGIPQVMRPTYPFNFPVPTAPEEHTQLVSTVNNASLMSQPMHADTYAGPPVDSSASSSASTHSSDDLETLSDDASTSHHTPSDKSRQVPEPSHTINPPQQSQSQNITPPIVETNIGNPSQVSDPLVSEEVSSDGPIHYPPIDLSPVDLPSYDVKAMSSRAEQKNDYADGAKDNASCLICLDAPLEGACVPCGHMAGCMSCLNEIKAKKWGCPLCRAEIDQVIRIYKG